MNEHQQLSREATELICSLAEKRKKYSKVILDPDELYNTEQPYWVILERLELTIFINRERGKRGFLSVSTGDVLKKVEKPAVGHVDYAQKIGYGAADLILQEN